MSEIGSANRHSAQNGEFPTQWREQRLVGSLLKVRYAMAEREETAGSVTQSGRTGYGRRSSQQSRDRVKSILIPRLSQNIGAERLLLKPATH